MQPMVNTTTLPLHHPMQSPLYPFLFLSMLPVIPLREAECAFEDAQVRTTSFSSVIP
jgi:hypothetical protein